MLWPRPLIWKSSLRGCFTFRLYMAHIPNRLLLYISNRRDIIFGFLTCCHLMIFLSWLPSKNKVAVESLLFQRQTNFLVKLQCSVFHQPEGSLMNFSFPKKLVKWKQVKTTNVILQRLEVFCRFEERWITWNH